MTSCSSIVAVWATPCRVGSRTFTHSDQCQRCGSPTARHVLHTHIHTHTHTHIHTDPQPTLSMFVHSTVRPCISPASSSSCSTTARYLRTPNARQQHPQRRNQHQRRGCTTALLHTRTHPSTRPNTDTRPDAPLLPPLWLWPSVSPVAELMPRPRAAGPLPAIAAAQGGSLTSPWRSRSARACNAAACAARPRARRRDVELAPGPAAQSCVMSRDVSRGSCDDRPSGPLRAKAWEPTVAPSTAKPRRAFSGTPAPVSASLPADGT